MFVQAEDGTAKLGRDFSHSSARLVQFDPGESDGSTSAGLQENQADSVPVLLTLQQFRVTS